MPFLWDQTRFMHRLPSPPPVVLPVAQAIALDPLAGSEDPGYLRGDPGLAALVEQASACRPPIPATDTRPTRRLEVSDPAPWPSATGWIGQQVAARHWKALALLAALAGAAAWGLGRALADLAWAVGHLF